MTHDSTQYPKYTECLLLFNKLHLENNPSYADTCNRTVFFIYSILYLINPPAKKKMLFLALVYTLHEGKIQIQILEELFFFKKNIKRAICNLPVIGLIWTRWSLWLLLRRPTWMLQDRRLRHVNHFDIFIRFIIIWRFDFNNSWRILRYVRCIRSINLLVLLLLLLLLQLRLLLLHLLTPRSRTLILLLRNRWLPL